MHYLIIQKIWIDEDFFDSIEWEKLESDIEEYNRDCQKIKNDTQRSQDLAELLEYQLTTTRTTTATTTTTATITKTTTSTTTTSKVGPSKKKNNNNDCVICWRKTTSTKHDIRWIRPLHWKYLLKNE